MIITLAYSLTSQDNAILSLSTAQFRNDECADAGELVDPEQRLVKRGSGTLTIHLTWSGDTGEHTRGRIFGHGSLSFTGMFWESRDGRRGPRFGIYDSYKNSCSSF